MTIIIYLILGAILLGMILSLDTTTNKSFEKKIKGKNVSMPNLSLMFGKRKDKGE